MIEYETKLKKWGNSMGVIIPKERVRKEKLREEQTVRVIVNPIRSVKVKDIFGKLKEWKSSTRGISRKANKEIDIEF